MKLFVGPIIGPLDYQKNWFGGSEIFLTLFVSAIFSWKFCLGIDLGIPGKKNWGWIFLFFPPGFNIEIVPLVIFEYVILINYNRRRSYKITR